MVKQGYHDCMRDGGGNLDLGSSRSDSDNKIKSSCMIHNFHGHGGVTESVVGTLAMKRSAHCIGCSVGHDEADFLPSGMAAEYKGSSKDIKR